MDTQELYDSIASRKHTSDHLKPYAGGNGRVDRCVELFRKGVLRKGGTLLDVGGSIGDLGYALKDDFECRIILDISAQVLEAARSKGNWTLESNVDKDGFGGYFDDGEGAVLTTRLKDESVNVVTALDFIEHIVDPGGFARECFRVLQTGGQVFVNTPNIQFWKHQQHLAITGRFPHTSGDQEVFHGGHLAFYTFLDLCDIFGAAGFKQFEQILDEEGYVEPVPAWTQWYHLGHKVKSREEHIQMAMRLGCPNLLFKCEKF
jgi:2-polyprenyl-3-methyl-5-hydroxy-6-metoxy-1,4-benzoquinol methylase